MVDRAALEQLVFRHVQRAFRIARALELDRVDAAEQRYPAARLDHGRQGIDRHVRIHARHQQHGLAALGHRRDGLDIEAVGSEYRRARDRLLETRRRPVAPPFGNESLVFLGFQADARHRRDGLDRIFAGRGFGRQHYGVGAVEHRIGNVGYFGARRNRVVDHRLHHLRCRDHQLVAVARHADHAFLQRGDRGITDLNREIAACDHDQIRSIEDFGERGNRLGALDLGTDHAFATGLQHQVASPLDISAGARERNREEIRLQLRGSLDVLNVLRGQRRRGEPAPLAVDALVVRQLAALLDQAENAGALDLHHPEHDASVVEQQRVAGRDILRQILVIESDAARVAELALGVEHEFIPRAERDAIVLEAADANLRTLQIDQHPDRAAGFARERAHQFDPLDMFPRCPVGKVHSHHVETGFDHARERLLVARGRAERGDNLGAAGHQIRERVNARAA